ncbi:hypothetical protein [Rubritalea tangerina]|uniref:OSBS enolase-like N-terminal domain-containing protein n=1 Tax=Rubritalea tangerina TaxID=430798 RepID=A0ABW4Z8N3_9BACT
MSAPIYIHRYTLHSRDGLNSRSDQRSHKGLLIRINEGVGCIHPWQIFGDPSIEEVIEDLKKGRFYRPLIRPAIKCAMVDGAMRREGVSAFQGVEIPRSHATIVGGGEAIDSAVGNGFEVIKMKAGRNLEEEVELLNEASSRHPGLKWRLDFNNVPGAGQLKQFIEALDEGVRESIDFFEDPSRVDDPVWQQIQDVYGISVAMDREEPPHGVRYQYSVIKPAVDDLTSVCTRAMVGGQRVVLTSYMDHPIGQCFAAWSATKIEKRFYGLLDPIAGLMTHGLFEADAFIERMGDITPDWKSPGGTGFGFDDLLESITWEKLG